MDQALKQFIVEKAKAAGIEILEENAIAVVKFVFEIFPEIAAKTENKYDDLAVPVLAVIRPQIMKLLDQINPADNTDEPVANTEADA